MYLKKEYNDPIYSLVKYNNILKAINSRTSGITTYIGLYPSILIIIGYTCSGGGLAMINNSMMALEKLCNNNATVKIIRPSVKLDLIFLYI